MTTKHPSAEDRAAVLQCLKTGEEADSFTIGGRVPFTRRRLLEALFSLEEDGRVTSRTVPTHAGSPARLWRIR